MFFLLDHDSIHRVRRRYNARGTGLLDREASRTSPYSTHNSCGVAHDARKWWSMCMKVSKRVYLFVGFLHKTNLKSQVGCLVFLFVKSVRCFWCVLCKCGTFCVLGRTSCIMCILGPIESSIVGFTKTHIIIVS